MRLSEHTELPTRKRNRLSARSPRNGTFWCAKCDRAGVAIGQKCRLCGHRDYRRPMHKGEVK